MCYTMKVNENNGGVQKRGKHMIRKKRIYEFIFEIKPNLLKKSI